MNRDQIEKFIPNLNPGNLLLIQDLKTDEPFWAVRPTGIKSNYTFIEFNVKLTTCGTLYVGAQKIEGTKWLDATENTLYYYENMLIQSLYPSDQEYYPYGLSNILDESPVYEDKGGVDYVPTTTTWRMLRDRVLKTFGYTSLTLQKRFPTTFQVNRGLNSVNFPETIHMNQTIDTIDNNVAVNLTGLNASSIYNIYFAVRNNHPQFPDLMHSDYVAQLNYKTKLLEEVLNVSSIHKSWIFGNLVLRLLAVGLIVMLLLI